MKESRGVRGRRECIEVQRRELKGDKNQREKVEKESRGAEDR